MQAGAIRASNEGAMGQLIQASLKAGGLDVDGDDMTEAVAYMQQVRDPSAVPVASAVPEVSTGLLSNPAHEHNTGRLVGLV